ncbi:AHH domain-containing protein [Gimesia maris]|uniref:Uncharacterized protein n=1 Tax=Gimesia maris TaxID=122 RepID=A0A3D3RIK5_9PLAN|nr:hypothetical protein [Gimesia maris]
MTNRHLERTTEHVYNIEVDGDHVYRVGQGGLLVHNASEIIKGKDYGCGNKAGNGNLTGSSSKLRTNLGCGSTPFKSAAHHVLSSHLVNSTNVTSALLTAEKLGFDINGSFNGLCLPTLKDDADSSGLPLHSGGHSHEYYRCVRSLLIDLEDDYKSDLLNDCQLCDAIMGIIGKLKSALENHEIWLQNEDPNKGATWSCPT